jgi:hypothetical protein
MVRVQDYEYSSSRETCRSSTIPKYSNERKILISAPAKS